MPADESHDPVPEQGCIHHPGQQEKYLSIEQPWLKHCRLCALNLALCGRTIQKDLSLKQLNRKMSILTTLSRLNDGVEQLEQTNEGCSRAKELLEQISHPLLTTLKEIDEQLDSLTALRNALNQFCNIELTNRIREGLNLQSQGVLLKSEIVKQIQVIECLFGDLIDLEDDASYCTRISGLDQLVARAKVQATHTQSFVEEKSDLRDFLISFIAQLDSIKEFRMTINCDISTELQRYVAQSVSSTSQKYSQASTLDLLATGKAQHNRAHLKLRSVQRKENNPDAKTMKSDGKRTQGSSKSKTQRQRSSLEDILPPSQISSGRKVVQVL